MTYSIIGILAAIILLIANHDLLWHHHTGGDGRTQRYYRAFLLGVLAYYITDALWGVLDARRLTALEYADTAVHFAAMSAAVMLWTQYVVTYLEGRSVYGRMLYYAGRVFLALKLIVIAVNFFFPILFRFDEAGDYHAGVARYVSLAIQVLLFLLTSAYTLYITARSEGKTKRRHRTIGLFGIAMVALIAIQIFYPLLPFYSMGYLLGTCVLHSFVVEDEKKEYREELERALGRERLQREELSESREALKDALAAAEEASKAKTAFLSNMSHEIRTPMNAIIGLDNIALSDDTISDATREHLEKIGASARHLLGIINDVLDMSRIESGRMVIKNEEFSFAETLEQVNTIIGGQCREKGVRYDCRVIGKVDDYYFGDDMKLRQVMINILGNAVKFTPEGGKVTFTVEETARFDGKTALRLTFEDTGIGMSEEYLPKLFDAFSQEDSSSTNKYGSTGLGMPITKSIVELMNGHIEVRSQKGVGTTFTVTLTLIDSDRKTEPDASGESFAEKNEQTRSTVDLAGRRVLLAEDVAVNAEIIIMVLSMRDVEVDHAENGRIAVEKFTAGGPGYYSAILMDMRMPEMDGLEAAKAIRAMDREDAKTIPIIALTANAFDEDVQRSMQAGLNAHLSKPVEPDALFQTLESLIV